MAAPEWAPPLSPTDADRALSERWGRETSGGAMGVTIRVRLEADDEATHVVVQVAPDREVDRVYERNYFEANFVPADKVGIVGEGASDEEDTDGETTR